MPSTDGAGSAVRHASAIVGRLDRIGRVVGAGEAGLQVVDVSDPFALTKLRIGFDQRDDLVVTPEIERLESGPASPFGGASGLSLARHLFRTGEEFYTMRQYQEGDDLRRIHWPSVARTGELMIRQDESTRRASGLVFFDTRTAALGRTHTPAFERGVSVAASIGVLLARRGFVLRLGTTELPAAALSEDRFMDALTGMSHAEVRSMGPALAHLRAGSSPDTSLVFVSAPPVPAEVGPLIRAGAGFGQKLAVLIYPTDPVRLPPERQAQLEGRASQARPPAAPSVRPCCRPAVATWSSSTTVAAGRPVTCTWIAEMLPSATW